MQSSKESTGANVGATLRLRTERGLLIAGDEVVLESGTESIVMNLSGAPIDDPLVH